MDLKPDPWAERPYGLWFDKAECVHDFYDFYSTRDFRDAKTEALRQFIFLTVGAKWIPWDNENPSAGFPRRYYAPHGNRPVKASPPRNSDTAKRGSFARYVERSSAIEGEMALRAIPANNAENPEKSKTYPVIRYDKDGVAERIEITPEKFDAMINDPKLEDPEKWMSEWVKGNRPYSPLFRGCLPGQVFDISELNGPNAHLHLAAWAKIQTLLNPPPPDPLSPAADYPLSGNTIPTSIGKTVTFNTEIPTSDEGIPAPADDFTGPLLTLYEQETLAEFDAICDMCDGVSLRLSELHPTEGMSELPTPGDPSTDPFEF